MKNLLLSVMVFLLCSILNAQITVPGTSFSGFGNSKIINSTSNITLLNPASLNRFEAFSAGVSYQFESEIKEGNVTYKKYDNTIPANAGVVIPVNNFRFALGLSQIYNRSIGIPVSESLNSFDNVEFSNLAIKYTAGASYSSSNLFGIDKLSLGLFYNRIESKFNFGLGDNTVGANAFSAGLIYSFSAFDNYEANAGLSYEEGVKIYAKSGIKGFTPYLLLPDKLNFNSTIGLSKVTTLTLDMSDVLWSKIYNDKNDALEFNLNGIFKINNNFQISAGTYFSKMNYYNGDFDNSKTNTYLMGGIVYSIQNFVFDFSVIDGHLNSDKMCKQTLSKLSAGFHL